MTLNNLIKGNSARVIAINANQELKNRFSSFGLVKGALVYTKEYSLTKKTMEILINKTRIALRSSEAEKIEITQ
jgi:Fe2+ transport system protein FeoA